MEVYHIRCPAAKCRCCQGCSHSVSLLFVHCQTLSDTVKNAACHCPKEFCSGGSVSLPSFACFSQILDTLFSTPTWQWKITQGGSLLSDLTTTTKTPIMVQPPTLPLGYSLNLPLVHVHISNLAAQTGASLFLQTHSGPYHPSLPIPPSGLNWIYNKTENLTSYSRSRFTNLIAEASEPVPWGWKKVGCVEGFDRLSLMPGLLFSPKKDADIIDLGTLLRVSRQILTMEMSDKLCILERS